MVNDHSFSVAVVVPVYNEEQGLPSFILAVENALVSEKLLFVIVDDGSTDNTAHEFNKLEKSVTGAQRLLIRLSRNFGHAAAIFAGLTEIPSGVPVTVVMDGDFQDRPEDILSLVAAVRSGSECAYAIRTPDTGRYFLNYGTHLFYAIQRAVSSIRIPSFAGNFCAFTNRFREELLRVPEVEVFFPGIRTYLGFKQEAVNVKRGKRLYGTSKVGLSGLLSLAFVGLIGFSSAPMRLVFLFGLSITSFCLFMAGVVIFLRLVGLITLFGFTSLFLLILALSGLQIMCIGMLGEYLGKVFTEAKRRPRWIVKEVISDD
jgi:glycosyltransferase involved in cell wall biosynthesis